MIQISIDHYNGPMDLLLELVAKAKIDIYDIEISSITEEFLLAMQTINISSDELSSFIQMASMLVVMKARTLISDSIEEDEEVLSREELIERLVAYKRYKELALKLRENENADEGEYTKLQEDLSPFFKEEPLIIKGDASLLYESILQIIGRGKRAQKEFYVSAIMNADEFSLTDIQAKIRDLMENKKRFTFADLFPGLKISKPRLIATFLSVLELSKTKELSIRQDSKERITLYRIENKQ